MNWQERAEKAEAELARMAQQEPVAWMRPDDEGYDSHFRDHSTVVSCPTNPWTGYIPLYAGPVPAVAAGLPAIGPYRDFIPAPAVPDWNVNIERIRDVMHMLGISIEESVECFSAALPTNINRMTLAMKRHLQKLAGMTAAPAPSVPEEWREVMAELADDLAIEIDQSYPPERRAYPSEQRRYEGEMAIVNRARALLQSSQAALAVPNLVESHQIKAPDCRTCANRGLVNGLSQESYCDSCVYQGRDCRQNHFVDINKMVDAKVSGGVMTVDEALMKADDANYSSEAEITLAAEVRRLRNEIDQLRCQLAGCGVAALENTVGSRSSRAVRGDYGYSASYEYVCNAVDREISLREENERLKSLSSWQPMRTAPRDGTKIVVLGNNYGDKKQGTHICVALCIDGLFYHENDDIGMNVDSGFFLEHLTHWMPLPEPAP